MYHFIFNKLHQLHNKPAPATGIGLFRLLYGIVLFQEICFLLYFHHLIFDPIPYIDVEFPLIPFFLCLWAVSALFIIVGYQCQNALIVSYLFWIIFVQFTPMQRDFDGGFDAFMTGSGFFLLFMPTDKAFALDQLRLKLSTPFRHYSQHPKPTVSCLSYQLPVFICLGFLYFDSAIHKLFAEHWRNGLGAWLPSTQPYYVSAINMSWLLNQEILQKTIGYIIIVFQFSFIFFFSNRYLRPFYLFIGIGLHLGITISLNIYPFGLGMLIFYSLLVPFSWWRRLAKALRPAQPLLLVYYDKDCPLCNRTALTVNHFDIFKCIEFKDAQTYSNKQPALSTLPLDTLLTDLYSVDENGKVYNGINTYIQILMKMRYPFLIGWLLRTPGIHHLAKAIYRNIADNRQRITCNQDCTIPNTTQFKLNSFYGRFFGTNNPQSRRNLKTLTKAFLIICILQINSSIHYGLLYRLNVDTRSNPLMLAMTQASNSILLLSHSFIGITPHALYLHDHFEGYDTLLAITYTNDNGDEAWLPFINQEGRILAPHWGRVHSMWANIAVTPNIDATRLNKLIMKITAYWAHRLHLDLDNALFTIKIKKNSAPSYWVYDLLNKNLSGEWSNLGAVQWKQQQFHSNLNQTLLDNISTQSSYWPTSTPE
ncbi:DCC1-like thiol-disulfide oxidoreductase family protein [Methylotuvimicrobium sp. KM2]|uniref:DCC1-like thiol-disulfide oxidoreductase family protein n=1 Tax=Methylotuvimicrobium sp. KM2 TaxID=3133976 RepID=UPI003100F4EC